MSEKPDFGEPWRVDKGSPYQIRFRRGSDVIITTAESLARSIACVNACAGMADPATDLAALRQRAAELEQAALDLHSWSRRYCDGRSTYAPAQHNRATRKLIELGVKVPVPDGAPWARDPMGRAYDGLTDDEAAAVKSPSTGERKLWERIAELEASRARLARDHKARKAFEAAKVAFRRAEDEGDNLQRLRDALDLAADELIAARAALQPGDLDA